VRDDAADPAAVVEARDDLRLALIAGLQYLPPRQRAVLLLRDVLAFPAADVAGMLGTSTAAVKSALARARATLAEARPARDDLAEPSGADVRRLLAGYVAAFEASDAAALERVLRDDIVLETDTGGLVEGMAACLPFFRSEALGSPGDWRLLPVRANGQPAAGAYLRGEDGAHHWWGVAVLTLARDGIARITVFSGAGRPARYALPEVLG
jgi:RNA polymerase sigma-70 factor (ECF subfamily)